MGVRIKSKLFLGFGFFLSVITLIWIVGAIYINKLAMESRLVIKDNYESIQSVKYMLLALEEIKNIQTSWYYDPSFSYDSLQYASEIQTFEKNLRDEENNITEIGEKDASERLRHNFEYYLALFNKIFTDKNKGRNFFPNLGPAYNDVKYTISEINEINMQAIVRKSNYTQKSADKAFMYISIIGALCFIISFSLFFNYPGYIANPVKELTKGIKEIANKNYRQRLFFKSGDEFGELADAFNVMAERLDAYEHSNLASVIAEKKRIETIINNMNDAIIVLNEENKIIFCNKIAVGLLNLGESTIIGKYAPDISARNDLFQHIVKDIFTNPESSLENDNKPLKIFTDGKESYFMKEIHHVYYPGNNLSEKVYAGHVVALKNITKFQELDAAKTNFIATVSHEIKTPVSSIKMSLKLLEDQRIGTINEEQKNLIRSIKEETDRLLGITGELLDMAQVETGNIQLNVKPVNPGDIIQYCCDTMKIQAESKRLKLKLQVEDGLAPVVADMDKTCWVMINLVGNAIRYSAKDSEIIISAFPGKNEIIFSVQDFGIGIDEQYRDKIFEKYFKVPGSEKTGSGLGLAISKDFITGMHGRIWLESEVGEGSTFYFALPVIAG